MLKRETQSEGKNKYQKILISDVESIKKEIERKLNFCHYFAENIDLYNLI